MLRNITLGGLTEDLAMAKPLTRSQAAKRAAQEMERQLSHLESRLAEEN